MAPQDMSSDRNSSEAPVGVEPPWEMPSADDLPDFEFVGISEEEE